MEVIIGMLAVAISLFYFHRFTLTSSQAALLQAGAVRRPLSSELKSQPVLGLATISPAIYENGVRALLTDKGIVLSFKGTAEEYFLPMSLISVTGKSWLYHPLTFGHGKQTVKLNLGDGLPERIKKIKSEGNIQSAPHN
jgi:hypothetical protein